MPLPIVILTGAGISAESGVATFRDAGGLWEGHNIQEVATPEGFRDNPKLVHQFYNARRRQLYDVQPNAAHLALAQLQHNYAGEVSIITQNVDDLHERGGCQNVIHMHGELRKVRCTSCAAVLAWNDDLEIDTACSKCGRKNLRPDIVWFGEMPFHLDRIEALCSRKGVFAAIGTSGEVYPAAGLSTIARYAGMHTIEINNADTAVSSRFHERLVGPASIQVPSWVNSLLDS